MRLIYKDRREEKNSSDWIIHTEFDPVNIKKQKQVTKIAALFKGKCVYARLNKDAETPEALKALFVQDLKQVQNKSIVVNTKQDAAIHFKTCEEAKEALETIKSVQVDGGFRLRIL